MRPEDIALENARKFLDDLQDTGSGASASPERLAKADVVVRNVKFFGFSIINRGNTYKLCLPGAALPAGPHDEVVIVLDGTPTLWRQGLSIIRSAPSASQLRQALTAARGSSDLRDALDAAKGGNDPA